LRYDRHEVGKHSSKVNPTVRPRNERIVKNALRHEIESRVPFVCECGDPDCFEFVLLHPRDYYKTTRDAAGGCLTAAGHPTPQDLGSPPAA